MTDTIKLPPFPEGMCLREDIEDYARAAVEADRAQRVPDGWALVPIDPDDALLRPFYACPPDELGLAWRAMQMVAARKSRLLASTPAPAQQPLTDEQIYGLYRRAGLEVYHQRDAVVQRTYDRCINDFARAIEQAHGIGVEND